MSESQPDPGAYARAGVDIAAATDAVSRMKSHIAATKIPGVLTDAVGSFGGMFSLREGAAGIVDPVLVSSIDGVGTKLKIAFMTGIHDTVGRDLVQHCVNDILVQGATPLFFLDYFGTGRLKPEVAASVVKGIAEGCRGAACALIGGETAEMPGMYEDGEYDLAGCIVGIVDRAKIVDGSRIADGDVLLGLASEGLHTNGYSLARKVLLEDAAIPLTARFAALGGTLGDALLWPHRCYLNVMKPLLAAGDRVRGMAHITGGGLTDNVPRVLPSGLGVEIDRSAWDVPPLFRLIAETGSIPDDEMLHAFNMGIGFVAIVSEKDEAEVAASLEASGEQVTRIGRVVTGSGVRYMSQ